MAPYQRFVAAQMALAKGIQTRWTPPLSPPASPEAARAALRDLPPRHRRHHRGAATTLRQALPLLPRQREAFRKALGEGALGPGAAGPGNQRPRGRAALALRFGALAPEGLAALKAQGTLRVGTTGDYAPFNYRTAEGALAGIDIDLAQAFAESLGLKQSW